MDKPKWDSLNIETRRNKFKEIPCVRCKAEVGEPCKFISVEYAKGDTMNVPHIVRAVMARDIYEAERVKE